VRFFRDIFAVTVMPRELDRVGGGVARQNKRPPLIKTAGCCLMLDPHYSSSNMYLGDEGTYVCKAFSPRSYVIQKVCAMLTIFQLCATPFCVSYWCLLIARDFFFVFCDAGKKIRCGGVV